jgi:hypothetical protein
VELLDSLVQRDGAIVTRWQARKRDIPADGGDLREAVKRHEFFQELDRWLRQARLRPDVVASIPGNAYSVHTGAAAISLAAAGAKTILYTNSAAANQPSFTEMCVSFDGVSATAVPALIELVYGNKTANFTPGTGSTAFTALQLRGWPTQASAQASANNCTTEPTVLTTLKQWLLTPNGGLLYVQYPLGREPTGAASGAAISGIQVGVRVTAPAIVGVRGFYEYEE